MAKSSGVPASREITNLNKPKQQSIASVPRSVSLFCNKFNTKSTRYSSLDADATIESCEVVEKIQLAFFCPWGPQGDNRYAEKKQKGQNEKLSQIGQRQI